MSTDAKFMLRLAEAERLILAVRAVCPRELVDTALAEAPAWLVAGIAVSSPGAGLASYGDRLVTSSMVEV